VAERDFDGEKEPRRDACAGNEHECPEYTVWQAVMDVLLAVLACNYTTKEGTPMDLAEGKAKTVEVLQLIDQGAAGDADVKSLRRTLIEGGLALNRIALDVGTDAPAEDLPKSFGFGCTDKNCDCKCGEPE
jgi:hypothetical protein